MIQAVLKKNGENVYPYLIYKPVDYDTSTNLPVIIIFHGNGDGGDGSEASMRTTLMKHNHYLKQAIDGKEFPFIIIMPQAPRASTGQYNFSTEQITGYTIEKTQTINAVNGLPMYANTNLLSHILRTYAGKIDPNRIYLTGYSAGGGTALKALASTPDKFAAALVASPAIEKTFKPEAIIDKPVKIFQNGNDTVVPPENIDSVAFSLAKINNKKENIQYKLNNTGGHDAWTAMFANTANLTWLLSQSLPTPVLPEPEPVYDFETKEPREYTIKLYPGSSIKLPSANVVLQSPLVVQKTV